MRKEFMTVRWVAARISALWACMQQRLLGTAASSSSGGPASRERRQQMWAMASHGHGVAWVLADAGRSQHGTAIYGSNSTGVHRRGETFIGF